MTEQQYTPDEFNVRMAWVTTGIGPEDDLNTEFDRWLEQERARARREGQAEAFDEGWKARAEREPRVMNIRSYSAPPPPHGLNPYRNGEDRHVDQ